MFAPLAFVLSSARFLLALLLVAIAGLQSLPASAQTISIDGVPIPEETKSFETDKSFENPSYFTGLWLGAWGNSLKHILIVDEIRPDGSTDVVYAYGDAPWWGIKAGLNRYPAQVDGDVLTVTGNGFAATYRKRQGDRLIAAFRPGQGISQAVLARRSLDEIKGRSNIKWFDGAAQILETDLMEDGKPVRLEIVTFSPPGPGPFPLAVVSHGSTGDGRNPAIAKLTWVETGIAQFLTERGYLVAFPQRRGRGNSDGLYDEGFRKTRSKGYSCSSGKSLRGADRAVTDLNAAIAVLKKHPSVTDQPILLSGVSRGGALSLAYAGRYPEQVSGVINFVGGWMGDRCKNAVEINGSLFQDAAGFPQETLWLYGQNDPFYSIGHIRPLFDFFLESGGTGSMHAFDVSGGNGHLVAADFDLWSGLAADYLDGLEH